MAAASSSAHHHPELSQERDLALGADGDHGIAMIEEPVGGSQSVIIMHNPAFPTHTRIDGVLGAPTVTWCDL
jgi:hypothetical protein